MSAFVCPYCGAESHNPNDVRERYCGRCHVFVDDPFTVLMKTEGLSFPEAVHRLACERREVPQK